jgi:hypothetical protein
MLDPRQLVDLPVDVGCTVYADDRLPGGFYVVPTAPRIAIGEDGRPALQLTVYGHRQTTGFDPSGALLTMTTVLSLPAERRDRVVTLLRQRLQATWPADSDGPPPQPTLFTPEWVGATVEVRLTPGITVSGTPSLSGDNRCSLSANFDATQARTLDGAWADRLPDGIISYHGTLRTRSGSVVTDVGSSSVAITIETGDGTDPSFVDAVTMRAATSFDEAVTTTGDLTVAVSAPLLESLSDPVAAVSTVELG